MLRTRHGVTIDGRRTIPSLSIRSEFAGTTDTLNAGWQDGQEKTFALVFDTGEEVVAGLLQFAKDYNLSGAHLTAIGAFERVTLGFFDVAKKDYKKIAIQEQVELMSLVGNIAQDDKGDPKLHAHVVVGKSDGTAHGGHLLDAYVRRTLEVVMVEASQHLRRTMRGEFGLALRDLSL